MENFSKTGERNGIDELMGRKFCHYRTRGGGCAALWNVTCVTLQVAIITGKLSHKPLGAAEVAEFVKYNAIVDFPLQTIQVKFFGLRVFTQILAGDRAAFKPNLDIADRT